MFYLCFEREEKSPLLEKGMPIIYFKKYLKSRKLIFIMRAL
jgi:hypothetical protein